MKLNRNTTLILFAFIVIIGIVLAIKNGAKDPALSTEPKVVTEEVNEISASDMVVSVPSSHSISIEDSHIKWTAKKKIIPNYTDAGTFSIAEGSLNFDEGNMLTDGFIMIDVASLEVTETGVGGGFNGLARDMLSGRFLDAETYPQASFVITEVQEGRGGTFDVIGDLTIKDITKQVAVTLNAEYVDDVTVNLSTEFSIDRTDYGITFGSDKFFDNLGDKVIDDIVTLEILLQAVRS